MHGSRIMCRAGTGVKSIKMNKAVKEKRQRQLKITREEGRTWCFFFYRCSAACPITDMCSKFPIIL